MKLEPSEIVKLYPGYDRRWMWDEKSEKFITDASEWGNAISGVSEVMSPWGIGWAKRLCSFVEDGEIEFWEGVAYSPDKTGEINVIVFND